MDRLAPICVLIAVACGQRPDECTPDELGWSSDDGCFFDERAEFFSDDRQDCGLSTRGRGAVAMCHAYLTFNDDLVSWQVTDFSERSPYECDGETLTFERDDITASWDATTNVLTWNGLAYLPHCPR